MKMSGENDSDKLIITLTGEALKLLREMSEEANTRPTTFLRTVIESYYDEVWIEEIAKRTRRTLKRKAALAVNEAEQYVGVEVYGRRFRAFFIDPASGQTVRCGTHDTALSAALAHDGGLWETMATDGLLPGQGHRPPLKLDPKWFNFPKKYDYSTERCVEGVAMYRRRYFERAWATGVEVDPAFKLDGPDQPVVSEGEEKA